jgi:hypothetical protein
MARKSTSTTGATPKPQGAMVINIHIDGDISLKLGKLIINNDNFHDDESHRSPHSN